MNKEEANRLIDYLTDISYNRRFQWYIKDDVFRRYINDCDVQHSHILPFRYKIYPSGYDKLNIISIEYSDLLSYIREQKLNSLFNIKNV